MLEPKHLTDQECASYISNQSIVIADYYADWCGPCQMMLPIFSELTTKMDQTHPEIAFAKINIDECSQATDEAGVMSVPTFIVYKNGEEVDRHIGGASLEELQKFVESNL